VRGQASHCENGVTIPGGGRGTHWQKSSQQSIFPRFEPVTNRNTSKSSKCARVGTAIMSFALEQNVQDWPRDGGIDHQYVNVEHTCLRKAHHITQTCWICAFARDGGDKLPSHAPIGQRVLSASEADESRGTGSMKQHHELGEKRSGSGPGNARRASFTAVDKRR